MLQYSQCNELFEALDFGIIATSLPLRHCTPGDPKPVGQSRLRQADGDAQRQHQLTEGIVALPVRVSLHE